MSEKIYIGGELRNPNQVFIQYDPRSSEAICRSLRSHDPNPQDPPKASIVTFQELGADQLLLTQIADDIQSGFVTCATLRFGKDFPAVVSEMNREAEREAEFERCKAAKPSRTWPLVTCFSVGTVIALVGVAIIGGTNNRSKLRLGIPMGAGGILLVIGSLLYMAVKIGSDFYRCGHILDGKSPTA